jgi:hypothetical protein
MTTRTPERVRRLRASPGRSTGTRRRRPLRPVRGRPCRRGCAARAPARLVGKRGLPQRRRAQLRPGRRQFRSHAARGGERSRAELPDQAEADYPDPFAHPCVCTPDPVQRDRADGGVGGRLERDVSGDRRHQRARDGDHLRVVGEAPPPQATRVPGAMPSTPSPTWGTTPADE